MKWPFIWLLTAALMVHTTESSNSLADKVKALIKSVKSLEKMMMQQNNSTNKNLGKYIKTQLPTLNILQHTLIIMRTHITSLLILHTKISTYVLEIV